MIDLIPTGFQIRRFILISLCRCPFASLSSGVVQHGLPADKPLDSRQSHLVNILKYSPSGFFPLC